MVTNGSGKVAVSDVTATELGYLDGVTSAIQTQLDAKLASAGANNFTSNVTITSTDAGAAHGPELALNRNSASPADNDFLGKIVFNGENDASEQTIYGTIFARATDVTDGTEDGNMSFKVMNNGTVSDRLALRGGNPTLFMGQNVRLNAVNLEFLTASSKLTTLSPSSASNNFDITLPGEDGTLVVSTTTDALETRRAANIAGGVSTITTSDLTASRALVSSGSGKVAVSAVTSTELGYLDGVSSAIQTQIDSKQATITGAATTIDDADLQLPLNAVRLVGLKIAVSDVTSTELGYLDGVTSAVQTQLDAKATLDGATFTGQVNMSDDLVVTGNLTVNGVTTTVSTTNLDVEDRIIMLADGTTGSPSADVGILFNRGNQGNAAFSMMSLLKPLSSADTKDPKSNTSLSPVTASNLDIGTLYINWRHV